MDWSKAKTVLIIGLLIANLALGGLYLAQQGQGERDVAAFAHNTEIYLANMGVDLETSLPLETPRLPVLFVTYGEGGDASREYGGLRVEGGAAGVSPAASSAGDTKQQVRPAASAALELANELGAEQLKGLVIEDVELVYWIDSGSFGGAATEDTAVPSWKFSTNLGDHYLSAYEE